MIEMRTETERKAERAVIFAATTQIEAAKSLEARHRTTEGAIVQQRIPTTKTQKTRRPSLQIIAEQLACQYGPQMHKAVGRDAFP